MLCVCSLCSFFKKLLLLYIYFRLEKIVFYVATQCMYPYFMLLCIQCVQDKSEQHEDIGNSKWYRVDLTIEKWCIYVFNNMLHKHCLDETFNRLNENLKIEQKPVTKPLWSVMKPSEQESIGIGLSRINKF